jgi:hypothetical protein
VKVTAAGEVNPIVTHDANKRLKWGRFDTEGRFAGIEFRKGFQESGESFRFVVYATDGELLWEDVASRAWPVGASLPDGSSLWLDYPVEESAFSAWTGPLQFTRRNAEGRAAAPELVAVLEGGGSLRAGGGASIAVAPIVDAAGNSFIAGETLVDGAFTAAVYKVDPQNHCTTYVITDAPSSQTETLWQLRDGALLFSDFSTLAQVRLTE